MLEELKAFIDRHHLCDSADRLLMAVSGGMDSVAMAHLLVEAGYECSIAHCNYGLRGSDSDGDAAFVRRLATQFGIPFYIKNFDLKPLMEKRGISLQMAAREERYRWFDQLLKDKGYDRIATGHHMDDSVETFFLHLARGTGIRGLTGIPVRKDRVIRPIMFASRNEIAGYCRNRKISYRVDASNLETRYSRNRIRHQVLPVLEQLNPSFTETMRMNISHLREVFRIYEEAVDRMRSQLLRPVRDGFSIEIDAVRSLKPRQTWLHELFSPFGFSRSQCEGIGRMMESEPGRRSHSPTHTLFRDRDTLLLLKSEVPDRYRYLLPGPESLARLPFSLDVEEARRGELAEVPEDPRTACLDLDRLEFPLILRHWEHGDYFYPFGMNGKKKVSDFFIDQKIPLPEKERIWIMTSNEQIVWIVGHRIDNRFRITDKTSRILLLRLQPDVLPQGSEKDL